MMVKNKSSFEISGSLLAGAVASSFDLGIFFLLNNILYQNYMLATVCGFLVGTFVNYELNTRYIFSTTKYSYQKGFVIFALIGILGLVLTTIFMKIMVETFHQDKLFSRICVYFFVFLFNFILRKKFIF